MSAVLLAAGAGAAELCAEPAAGRDLFRGQGVTHHVAILAGPVYKYRDAVVFVYRPAIRKNAMTTRGREWSN